MNDLKMKYQNLDRINRALFKVYLFSGLWAVLISSIVAIGIVQSRIVTPEHGFLIVLYLGAMIISPKASLFVTNWIINRLESSDHQTV